MRRLPSSLDSMVKLRSNRRLASRMPQKMHYIPIFSITRRQLDGSGVEDATSIDEDRAAVMNALGINQKR